MNARLFSISGLRLLAALSFIKAINGISLWMANLGFDIRHETEVFGFLYVATIIVLCAIPFLVGAIVWLYAPKIADLFFRDLPTEDPDKSTKSSKKETPDFLAIALVAVSVLILINVIPNFAVNLYTQLFELAEKGKGWNTVFIPMAKITLCFLLILRAKALASLFRTE